MTQRRGDFTRFAVVGLFVLSLVPAHDALAKKKVLPHRPLAPPSREELVKRTIAEFVQAVNLGGPEVLVQYMNGVSDRKAGQRTPVPEAQELAVLLTRWQARDDVRFQVSVLKPRVTWRGRVAVVQCNLLWWVESDGGAQVVWNTSEEFELEDRAGPFRIVSGKVLPSVARSIKSTEAQGEGRQ